MYVTFLGCPRNRPYALTSSRRHVGGQSHCLVRACATGTFLTTAFTRNPIDPPSSGALLFLRWRDVICIRSVVPWIYVHSSLIHCRTLICPLNWFQRGFRLFSDVWSENTALFKRLELKFIQIHHYCTLYYGFTCISGSHDRNVTFQSWQDNCYHTDQCKFPFWLLPLSVLLQLRECLFPCDCQNHEIHSRANKPRWNKKYISSYVHTKPNHRW